METSTHNVFVYGSLISDDIVSLVIRRVPQSVPARLPDFHRYSIKGRTYPAILPVKGDEVKGKVLFGITEEELQALDDFEDVEYVRQTVQPILMDAINSFLAGDMVESHTYVWADAQDEDLYGDWDYEEWRKLHYEDFCGTYVPDHT